MDEEICVRFTGKLNSNSDKIYCFLSEEDRDKTLKLVNLDSNNYVWSKHNGLPCFTENFAVKHGFWKYLVVEESPDFMSAAEVIPDSGMYWVRDGDPV